jgi:hypothetical protein
LVLGEPSRRVRSTARGARIDTKNGSSRVKFEIAFDFENASGQFPIDSGWSLRRASRRMTPLPCSIRTRRAGGHLPQHQFGLT